MDSVASVFASQLSEFVATTRSAISSVAYLTINIGLPADALHYNSNETAITAATTAILQPLAAACPRLRSLKVSGQIGSHLLERLGSECPNLTSLTAVLIHLPSASLKQLSTLLPHLTSLTTLAGNTIETQHTHQCETKERWGIAFCEALKGCPSLMSLNTDTLALTERIWTALPEGLSAFSCMHAPKAAIRRWNRHKQLVKFEIKGEVASPALLVDLLDVAPNAAILYTMVPANGSASDVNFQLGCSLYEAEDLEVIDDSLQLGTLQLFHASQLRADYGGSPYIPGLVFCLGSSRDFESQADNSDRDESEHPLGVFMSKYVKQPLVKFTSIMFIDDEYQSYDDHKKTGDFSHIHRVFPSVQTLHIENIEFGTTEDVQSLINCASLQELHLENIGGFSEEDVKALCRGSKSLREVSIIGCRSVCLQWGRRIEAKGGKLFGVQVWIDRGQDLEADDDEEDADAYIQTL